MLAWRALDLPMDQTLISRRVKQAIAIIEDDHAVVRSLAFALETEGYDVATFLNAQDMLRADPTAFGLLIIDYQLPDMTGLEMLTHLRKRGVGAPAILIASNPDNRCRREAVAARVPLVEKPLLGETLGDLIAQNMRPQ
jgi:two-component system response regulator FixJ